MLGITDPGIILAYGLSVISVIICIVYGIFTYNKSYDEEVQEEIKDNDCNLGG